MRKKSKKITAKKLARLAKNIRQDILKMSYQANVGHISSALSIADILAVLYGGVLKINSKRPFDKLRDRFILSKGHAASALYAALYQKGFIAKKKLFSFCQDGGSFGVHPEHNPKLGIELSTGSLGHGLSVGAGLALGLRNLKRVPRVFILLSDAELNEGSVWETVMFAAHHQLDNLSAIVDDNGLQAFGRAEEVINLQPLKKKWQSFGWAAKVVNGHDVQALFNALNNLPFSTGKPSVVIAKTTGGKGVSFMEDKIEWHYFPLNKKTYQKALKEVNSNP